MTTLFTIRTIQLIFFAVILVSPRVAFSQSETIPDTLDWRLYFPLQVGNIWEYSNDSFPQTYLSTYGRSEIVGETVINDQQYFVLEGKAYNLDLELIGEGSIYLRYDTTAQAVMQLTTTGCCPGEYSYQGACNLNAPFPALNNSISYTCPNGEGSLNLSGGYVNKLFQIGSDTVRVPAEKHFNFGGPGVTFLYGIGNPGGTSEGGYSSTSLIYLKVDDQEYGVSQVASLAPPVLHSPEDSTSVGFLAGHIVPQLIWVDVDSATSYRVQWAKDSTAFDSLLLDFTFEAGESGDACRNWDGYTCIHVGPSAGAGYYRWRVRSLSATDSSAWSEDRLLHISILVGNENSDAFRSDLYIHALYPNPTQAEVTLEFMNDQAEIGEVVVHDLLGRDVAYIYKGIISRGKTQLIWNAGRIAPGWYSVSIRTETRYVSKQFLVQP